MKSIEEQILYEDQHVLVCQKEAGIPVQTAKMAQMDLESMLKNYLAAKDDSGKIPYLAVIHRLDQPVCGVLVFAKTPFAAKELNKQVTNHTLGKYYLAKVDGEISKGSGTLTDFLLKDGKTNTSKVVKDGMPQSKKAVLHYKKIAEDTLEIELITGRHHQIRVQLAHAGMPLKGDRKYNPTGEGREKELALCAYRLQFVHPKTKKEMEFTYNPLAGHKKI